MKKTTTILFLVLAILFSFVGCDTASIGKEVTTSTESSFRSDLTSIFEKIDTAFEKKDSLQLNNISSSFFELIREKLDVMITPLLPEDRPSFCVIEYLPASGELDSHVSLTISFEDVDINDSIASSINKNFFEAHYFVDNISTEDLMSIVHTELEKNDEFEEHGLSDIKISISPLIVDEKGSRLSISN